MLFVHPAQIGDVREGKYRMRIVYAAQERLQLISVSFRALPEVRFGAAPIRSEPAQSFQQLCLHCTVEVEFAVAVK